MRARNEAPSTSVASSGVGDKSFLYNDDRGSPDASGLSMHLTLSSTAGSTASNCKAPKMQHPTPQRTPRTLLGGLKSGLRPFLEDTVAFDPLSGLRRFQVDDEYWHHKVVSWRTQAGRDARAVTDDADEFLLFQEYLRSLQYVTNAPIQVNLYQLLRRQRNEMAWRTKLQGHNQFATLPKMSQYECEFSDGNGNVNMYDGASSQLNKPSSPKSVMSIVHFESQDGPSSLQKSPPCVASLDGQKAGLTTRSRDDEEKKDDSLSQFH